MASSKLSLCAIHYRHTTKLIYSILFHTIQEQSPKPLDFSNNTTRKGGKSTSIQNHTALTPLRKLPFLSHYRPKNTSCQDPRGA